MHILELLSQTSQIKIKGNKLMKLTAEYKLKTRFDYTEAFIEKHGVQQIDFDRFNNEAVYMEVSTYEKIFGKKLKNTNREKRFMKISNKAKNTSLYRIWRGTSTSVAHSSGIIYLDSDGKSILSDSENLDKKETILLEIKPVSRFTYYWNTSNIMTRISFKTGVCSIILGIISLVLAVCQMFR